MKSPNEIQIAVNNLGFDLFPRIQKNGMYKIEVWKGDQKCYGLGKNEYKFWNEGINETYKNFYNKFK